MNKGALVKRSQDWIAWMRSDSYVTDKEENETGIVIDLTDNLEAIVLWSFTGISWEDCNDLEVLSEL